MTQLGSDGDDWEILQHHHDVLSGSDTEPTSEGESESRAAGAVIEALEETPQANLQGISLGSLPQFLGGWYGSSPPAAGRTFSVDLSQVSTPDPTPPSQPGSPAAGVDTVASDDFEDPLEDLSAAQAPADTEEQQGALPAAAPAAPLSSSNSTAGPSGEAIPPTTGNTPVCQAGHAARYCLLSAAALATLLLLLACSTGSPTPMTASTVQAMGAAPAWHTTSTDSYRPVGGHMYQGSISWAAVPAAPAAPPASADGSGSTAGRTQPVVLPWWLRDEAGSALRRGPHGAPEKLPLLPPQWHRANMSASQRLRLHLWLLHCAARNSSITQGLGRGQAAVPSVASTPFIPIQFWAASARPRAAHASPQTRMCRPSGTTQQWLASAKPAGHECLCPAAPATPMHPRGPSSSRPRGTILKACNAALCFAFRCEACAAASNISCAAAAPQPVAPPPAPTPLPGAPCAPWACAAAPSALHKSTPAAPIAAPPANTASATEGRKLNTLQPTRAVPPLYRPPLPCLLLGGRRPNSTMIGFRPQQPAAHQHNPAAPAARTKAWPNATARHQQVLGSAGVRARPGGRSGKLNGRALAIGMARWGWHQPTGRVGVCGTPPSLHVLPPVSQKGAGGRSSSSDSPRSGSTAGLSLPMLPPVACTAAANTRQQLQPQQQPGGVTLPMLPPVTPGGLTLPMLPPVSEGEGGRQGSCAGRNPGRAISGAVASMEGAAGQHATAAAGRAPAQPCSWLHCSKKAAACNNARQELNSGVRGVPSGLVEHPRRGACAMHCGAVSGDAEACGSVCVKRCAGMPALYVAIPAVAQGPSHSTQASFKVPRLPVKPSLSTAPSTVAAGRPGAPVPAPRGLKSSFLAAAAPIPLPAAQGPSNPTGTPMRTTPSTGSPPSCPAVAAAALPLSLPAAKGPSTPLARPAVAAAAAAACTPTPAWALLMPSGGRVCSSNGTTLQTITMLGAAAKLAAAAADLATAAADLATAAASLQAVPSQPKESCRPPPISALMGCKRVELRGAALFLAPSAGNGSSAGSAQGVQELEAGTRWVASLVTLPMLPPSQDEGNAGAYDHGVDENERDAESIGGAQVGAGCISSTRMVTPFGPLVSCNSSGEALHDVTSNKEMRRQPLWLAPVM